MLLHRHHALLLAMLTAAAGLGALNTGCGSKPASCALGSEGCDCTSGGACDPGLLCLSRLCVSPTSGSAGAGGPGTGGGGGGSGAAGTQGGPGTGGSGTAGTQASAGRGGASGSGGGPLIPPAPPVCTNSTNCAAGKVCVIKVDGTGACFDGSGKACASGDYCANGSGLEPVTGKLEGPVCNTTADCNQAIKGHLNTVCAASGSGPATCVPLCQYADDPVKLKCVTDPQIGVWDRCNRAQVRTLMTLFHEWPCHDQEVASWACITTPPALTSDEEWTLDCMGNRLCPGIGCVTEFGGQTKLSATQYNEFTRRQINFALRALPGGSSAGGKQCSTDCACGHCSYCESGICRYGGEGPYGCYRGCD